MHLIKRYSNRKLYDTTDKSYLTIEQIGELLQRDEEVRVVDNDTGKDITAVTLSRVLVDKQKRKGGFLSRSALTDLIARSRNSMFDFLKRQMPSWVGSAFVALEDVERNVRAMVEDRQITREEGRKLVDMLTARVRRNRQELERWVDGRVRATLGRLTLPSAADMNRLRRQVEELAARIDALGEALQGDGVGGTKAARGRKRATGGRKRTARKKRR